MKKHRFLTSLAIAGALAVTSPLSTFAADKGEPATANQPDSSLNTYSIQEVLKDLKLDQLLEQCGIQLDVVEHSKAGQPSVQSKPAKPKEKRKQPKPKKQKPANQPRKQPVPQPGSSNKTQTDYALSEFEKQVIDLTNQERAKYGLPALKVDLQLSKMARDKAQDMHDNNYFSHNSPTYGSPFQMMDRYGIRYNAAGENIAMGQRTPQEVVNDWMNSKGHRQNILSKNFNYIGVGYVKDGNYWVQEFIGR
ncbi:CAP domain-containing protein [Lihuaxuella thermophila]|uniref:Uncharacterized protein, YkwD family n=1 Tax=Lihuaxuella thermophila TaxID=1173111 RepID=A0A1H8EI11_9BACL|nr:CAP domain-containing protein [Lihuaxuella thermophila]SEN19125.1 uncharacterized protein, YkwD family [Lihuaxuella thermophila]